MTMIKYNDKISHENDLGLIKIGHNNKLGHDIKLDHDNDKIDQENKLGLDN